MQGLSVLISAGLVLLAAWLAAEMKNLGLRPADAPVSLQAGYFHRPLAPAAPVMRTHAWAASIAITTSVRL